MPSLENILSDFIAGLLVAILTGIFTYLFRSMRSKQGIQSTKLSGIGVATVVDDFIERQRKILRRNTENQVQPSEQKVVVEYRESRSNPDGNEPWGIMFLMLILIAILDGLWIAYKIPMFYVSMVVVGVGLGTSVYYIVQLRKMNPPYQLEDYILSYGSLFIWIISAVTSWLAVYYPLYTKQIDDKVPLDSLFLHATQFIGMVFLFLAIVITAVIQFLAGRVYQKALQHHPPNQIEIFIWGKRFFIFVAILIFSVIAFVLSTGVLF